MEISEDEYYATVLVHALRLSKDEMTRLIGDLVDRGAEMPFRTIYSRSKKEPIKQIVKNCSDNDLDELRNWIRE